MDFSDIALVVFGAAGAPHDITVFEPDRIPREESEIALGRVFAEVVAFYPELAAEGEFTLTGVGLVRVQRRVADLGLTYGVVGNDQIDRVQHLQAAMGREIP